VKCDRIKGCELTMNDVTIKQLNDELYTISKTITGPVLFDYVCWVLNESYARGIKKLYFAARDGYVLQKIAKQICEKYGLDIECRYLYCSRKALRMPTYHLIGDEAYDLLLMSGTSVTLRSLMERAELNENERRKVYAELDFYFDKEKEELSKLQLYTISKKIRESITYRGFIDQKSRQAYEPAMGYFIQEGLLDGNIIAIVDSGWTGSIQRSLRQLLESSGKHVNLIGFYFGMYVPPKEKADGEYLCWYFDHKSPKRYKILFNNNVLECMLSAPHGMTLNYKADGARGWEPVLNDNHHTNMLRLIETQINAILEYVNDSLSKANSIRFNAANTSSKARKLLQRVMVHPTRSEAEAIGTFAFCDDITEFYQRPLADESQTTALKNYMILPRIIRKLLRKKKKYEINELFWVYGTISFLPAYKRWWYRLNVYIWEWLRYTLK
jgi:hypothetical protein